MQIIGNVVDYRFYTLNYLNAIELIKHCAMKNKSLMLLSEIHCKVSCFLSVWRPFNRLTDKFFSSTIDCLTFSAKISAQTFFNMQSYIHLLWSCELNLHYVQLLCHVAVLLR